MFGVAQVAEGNLSVVVANILGVQYYYGTCYIPPGVWATPPFAYSIVLPCPLILLHPVSVWLGLPIVDMGALFLPRVLVSGGDLHLDLGGSGVSGGGSGDSVLEEPLSQDCVDDLGAGCMGLGKILQSLSGGGLDGGGGLGGGGGGSAKRHS